MPTVTPRLRRATYIALLGLTAGCFPDPQAEPEPVPPLLRGYASARLPFSVSPEVERMRQLYLMPALRGRGFVEDAPGLLIGVAAPSTHATVAFPSGERTGYDIAWAEDRKEWQRIQLNDLDVVDIGAVAAGQSRDDVAWFAFRGRTPPHDIRVWSWELGSDPEEVPFSRVGASPDIPEWADSCQDIDLAVADDGTVQIAYRHGIKELYLATLTPGATSWTHERVNTGRADVVGSLPGEDDIGCRVRLEFDEGGHPNVLTSYRSLPFDELDGPFERAKIGGGMLGFFRNDVGTWQRNGRRTTNAAEERNFGPRGMDMALVQDTNLVVGPIMTEFDVGNGPVDFLGLEPRPYRMFDPDSPVNEGLDIRDYKALPGDVRPCTSSFRTLGDPVGTPSWYGATIGRMGNTFWTSDHPSEWRVFRDTCRMAPGAIISGTLAPVRNLDDRNGVRSPTGANGRRDYDLVICIDQQNRLSVCGGGIEVEQYGGRLNDVEFGPGVGAEVFSILNGTPDTQVVTPGSLQLRLDIVQVSGPDATPTIGLERVDVNEGDFTRRSPDFELTAPSGNVSEWEIVFMAVPGATYRISVGPPERFWRSEGFGEIYVYASPDWLDPRDRAYPQKCPNQNTERDERGVCVNPFQRLQNSEAINLRYWVDIESVEAEPELVAPDGSIVPTSVVTDEVLGTFQWVELVPSVELDPFTEYTVRYPDGITNMFGYPLGVAEREFRVITEQGPLELDALSPADGATDVPIDASIVVDFNGPLADGLPLTQLVTLTDTDDMAMPEITLTVREQPGDVFEFTPLEPLRPNTNYRFVISEFVVGEVSLDPLEGAPVAFTFRTGGP